MNKREKKAIVRGRKGLPQVVFSAGGGGGGGG